MPMAQSTRPQGNSTDLQISTDPFFSDIINKDDKTYRSSQTYAKGWGL